MHDLARGHVVVTGGAGLIGSAVIWALNLRGIDDILVVDRLDASEKWKNLVPLRYRDYVDADEFETRVLNRAASFANVATVFHLGACSSTTETDAAYLMRNNYDYTKHSRTGRSTTASGSCTLLPRQRTEHSSAICATMPI